MEEQWGARQEQRSQRVHTKMGSERKGWADTREPCRGTIHAEQGESSGLEMGDSTGSLM